MIPDKPVPPLDSTDPAADVLKPTAKTAPLARLTRTQIENVAGDVLGARADIRADLPEASLDDTGTDVNLLVDSYNTVADKMATAAITTGALKGRCSTAADVSACVLTAVRDVAPRMWRRPLTAAEETDLSTKVITPAAALGGDEALKTALMALMMSPSFVFRVEVPVGAAGAGAKLSPHTVATRLAFLAWNSAPDQALIDSAMAGKLATPEQRRAFLDAQLGTEKGARALRDAHQRWLHVASLTPQSKDATAVPGFTATVVNDMLSELDSFIAGSFGAAATGWKRLWTGDTFKTPSSLRTLYGLPSSTAVTDVKMPSGQRSGVLTQLAVMSASSKSSSTNPVTRGLYIYETLLCQERPVPPTNVPSAPAKVQDGKVVSDRVRFEEHRAEAKCAACHQLFDGLGFGLEKYDVIGQFREKDGDTTLTGEGWSSNFDQKDVKFRGAAELGTLLSTSPSARACYTRRMIEWAQGHSLTDRDAALARAIYTKSPNGDMAEVFRGIAADPNFDRRDFQE